MFGRQARLPVDIMYRTIQTTQVHDQLTNAAPSAYSPPTIGTTIELLDDDDETTPAPSSTSSLPLSTHHHLSGDTQSDHISLQQDYSDFVSH